MASTDSNFNADQTTVTTGATIVFIPTTTTNDTYSWLVRGAGGAPEDYVEFATTSSHANLDTSLMPPGQYDIKLISTTVGLGENSTEKLAYITVEASGGGGEREVTSDIVSVSDIEGYNQSILDRATDGWELIWVLVLNDKIRLTYGRETPE